MYALWRGRRRVAAPVHTTPQRAYVPIPEGYFQMTDGENAAIDEGIVDETMTQLGVTADE